MIITLILVEIASIVGSSVLALKGVTDAILQISDNGYKLDMEILRKYHQEHLQNNEKKPNILSKIILFTPGVNLLCISLGCNKFKRKIMTDEEVRKALIPMTDDEKEVYSRLENTFEKLAITLDDSKNDTTKNRVSGLELGTASLHNEVLPETYTVEEVKRLNAVTNNTYRLGIVAGVPTAIIGIPGEDRIINAIKFKDEDYKVGHRYVRISEWEARDKSFVVYPFLRNHCADELDNCVKEIKDEKNKEESSVQPITNFPMVDQRDIEEPQIDIEREDTSIGEESGPTSVKRLVKSGPYKHKR